MNYLWEILLQAKEQEIKWEKLQFKVAHKYSPYTELSEEFLNVTKIEEPCTVELNPYYRFHSIFKDMFHPEVKAYPALRNGLFQLLMHQIGENDIKMGMTREEYYKKLLGKALEEKVYGEEGADAYALFDKKERELLLEGILTLYREGESLTLFRHVMCALISSCIVYSSNEDPYEILVYIGKRKSESLERKVAFLLRQFVGIRYHVEIYYEYHFGIIGIEDTMCIDEIAIC